MSRVFFNPDIYFENKPRLCLGDKMRLSGPYDKLTLKLQKLTGNVYFAHIYGSFRKIRYMGYIL